MNGAVCKGELHEAGGTNRILANAPKGAAKGVAPEGLEALVDSG
jgi:hypothetical protein